MIISIKYIVKGTQHPFKRFRFICRPYAGLPTVCKFQDRLKNVAASMIMAEPMQIVIVALIFLEWLLLISVF